MRKSKLIFACAGLTAVLLGVGLSVIPTDGSTSPRYQQHLEQPGEQDLEPCEDCDGSELCTHLPIIKIETGGQKIPGKQIVSPAGLLLYIETGDNGEEEILADISIVDQEMEWNHPSDDVSTSVTARFRIRGNSSRAFDKSSYRIALVDENNPMLDKKESMLGMNAESEWALHGPFLDKTMIRNYMGMNISGMVMGYAPEVRFCELVLDGEYQGLYLLMETPKVSESRTNLTRYEDGDLVFSYMVRIERFDEDTIEKSITNYTNYTYQLDENRTFELLYPGRLRQTEAVKQYVTEDLSEVERILYSADPSDREEVFEYIDLDSFVNYYILQELLAINDVFNASTYFYKDARGTLTVGPVWDYNNSFNNFFLMMPYDEFLLSQRGWFAQLMESPIFVERVITRWESLRKGILSDEFLNQYVEETQKWLGSAIDRNFEVWGYSFDPFQLNVAQRRQPNKEMYPGYDNFTQEQKDQAVRESNPENVEEATKWMVDFMNLRSKWMDEHIDTLRQYCQDSKKALQELR